MTCIVGLGDDDLAIVARLLDKVEKIGKKAFVHGRYLTPMAIVYHGE